MKGKTSFLTISAIFGAFVSLTAAQNNYEVSHGFSNSFENFNGFNDDNGIGSVHSSSLNGGDGFNTVFNGHSNAFGENRRSPIEFRNRQFSEFDTHGVNPEIAALAENIPGGGVPGQDYPVLSEIPDTGFECRSQSVSGYYADTADEAGCQVFHICQLRESGLVQQDSFLCPNGTIFNQQYFVCDWWFNFYCSSAQNLYFLNEQISQIQNRHGHQVSFNDNFGAHQNIRFKGKDNGRKADIYITHQFDDDSLKIVKEVQYKNDENRFVRNTYQFTKKQ